MTNIPSIPTRVVADGKVEDSLGCPIGSPEDPCGTVGASCLNRQWRHFTIIKGDGIDGPQDRYRSAVRRRKLDGDN